MRLGPTFKASIAALALVDVVLAADPEWKPISFILDPVSPIFGWSTGWRTAFGGVTNPTVGQVGWGPSQRVLDATTATTQAMDDINYNSISAGPPFFGSDLRVYGARTPALPDGQAIFNALVNQTLAEAIPTMTSPGVQAPGENNSAISIDLQWQSTDVYVFAAGGPALYTVDSVGFTTRIMTNYSSVDQIPQDTEYFVINGALNPRLRWVNQDQSAANLWKVHNGVADVLIPTSGNAPGGGGGGGNAGNAGGAGGATRPLASPVQTVSGPTTSSPAKDSGPQDYWQAISSNPGTYSEIPIPNGVSFIMINGTTGPGRTKLQAQILPLPPSQNTSTSDGTESFNSANNSWATDTILYLRELDPTVRYNLTLSPFPTTSNETATVGIHSITYWYGTSNGTVPVKPSNGPNIAAIVGGVVGGVAGGLLLAAIAVYFCVWKPRKRREREEAEHVASIENSRFTPFVRQAVDSEAANKVIPPSYNPAWADQFPSDSATRTNSGSDASLLGTNSNSNTNSNTGKQRTGGSGMSNPTQSTVPDWKQPYLPETHGGAALGGAVGPAVSSSQRGLFREKHAANASSRQSSEKPSTFKDEKGGQNLQAGYSEDMLRAINPDP
ncbi:hypothetical protein CcaverHIS002_0113040 [Cutaneotrichosporon cavernicola]|nr:hypothetical protein CcaverHIS002_0113040 [Cutaneotrichosporon cavernicola]BEI96346.1 hypothetical protein CcaverHIS631_0112950 [Cutaneotrichosporon cavernicola]BEJ04118.1 hypothetical protein CcaverHIS641_0112930 [Cutaneotrichosporon cavernicola]